MKNIKKSKTMSYDNQIRYEYLLSGIMFVISSILGLLQFSFIFEILQTIFMFIGVFFMFKPFFSNKEEEDEMAAANLNRACYRGLLTGQICMILIDIVISSVLSGLMHMDINITAYFSVIVFFVIGIQNIIVGYNYRKLEDE